MSQLVHPATLTDYSARTWVTGKAAFASQFNHEYKTIQNRISRLNQATKDVNTRHAGTTEPTSKQEGQIWFDTANNFWMGDPDGLGADEAFGTRLSAYQHSFKTAGTDTFKVRGLIESNTTAVTIGATTGTLMTYSVPANTVNSNGSSLRVTAFGTISLGSLPRVEFQTGAVPTQRFGDIIDSSAGTASQWITKITILRISSTSAKFFAYTLTNSNGSSIMESIVSSSTDVDFTAAQTVRLVVISDSVSTTQEGMLIELLN